MLGRQLVLFYGERIRSLCKAVRQTFVLIEECHYIFHGCQCIGKCFFPVFTSQSGKYLAGRQGKHHIIYQDICCIIDAQLFFCLFKIFCLKSIYIVIQFFHIRSNLLLTFCLVIYLIQIQNRNLSSAVDSDCIGIFLIISGILDI